MAHCTAQNKPKRFKQPFCSATARRKRASTFFSNLCREDKGGLGHRESDTKCECLN